MSDSNPLAHLSAREQAKLEDFVRKDLAQPGGDAAAGAAAAGAAPPITSGDSGIINEAAAADLSHEIKEHQREQAKKVHPITPSVDDPDEVPEGERPLSPDPDAGLEVDMFARGNVSKVVEDLKEKQAEAEVRARAARAKLPFVRLLGYPISPDVLSIVPEELTRHGVVAYLRAGKKVRLGITDPDSKAIRQAITTLADNTPYEYLISVIAQDSYRYALKLYEELPKVRRKTDDVAVTKGGRKSFEADIKSLVDLKSKIKEVPTTKVIDILLTGAVKVGASDVHIEPTDAAVKIRYRLDGVLQTIAELPLQINNSILSRLKFLAKLKLDINRMPQDGRFTIKDELMPVGGERAHDHQIDVRVATIPVQYGEAVTMRLLDRDNLDLTIDSLGLTGDALTSVLDATKRPQGMIIECGPTGSGKTTTLYSLLEMINEPGKKVITLEDPIEYRMAGIMQSQVQPEHGYDFAEGFRSILRLDPDIVMVGEIRDEQTAEYATQASLTGHVVLTTLHTNDAPTAIPRLLDLKVRPFLLSNAISVIVAQRLVRKVCSHCATEHKPDAVAWQEVKTRLAAVPKQHQEMIPPEKEWLFLQGKGCDHCNETGFAGRFGIFEVMEPSPEIEKLALEQAPVSKLKQAAARDGMMTMEQDGLIKAVTGVTTVDEVWRVARDI